MARSEEPHNYPMVVSADEGMDMYHGSDAPEAIQPAGNNPPAYGSFYGEHQSMPAKFVGAVPTSQPVKIEPEGDVFRQSQHAPINVSGQRPSLFQRHRRSFIIGGAIAAVVTVVAAVLGGVLGSRAANKAKANSSLAAQGGRIPSKKGAFNGTGLAVYSTNASATDYFDYLIYQDYTGLIKRLAWKYDNQTNKVVTQSSNTLVKDAANNTALRVGTYVSDDLETYKYNLLFTNNQGFLADVWNNNTEPNDPWYTGDLNSLNFKTAPADFQRATLLVDAVVVPLDIWRSNYSRAFAGGSDGQVHMFSLDLRTEKWDTNVVPLPNSYPYGGIDQWTGNSSISANTTIFHTLQDGTIQQRIIIDGDVVTNKSFYPEGRLQDPINSNVKAAVNSSLWTFSGTKGADVNLLNLNVPLLSYVTTDNEEVVTEDFNLVNLTPQSIQAPSQNWPMTKVMSGSDIVPWLTGVYNDAQEDELLSQTLIFYQADGDDISWWFSWSNGTTISTGKMDLLT